MKKTILDGLVMIAASALLIVVASAFIYSMRLPIVQFSSSSAQCVNVIPVGSCENLPKKYHKEWVK